MIYHFPARNGPPRLVMTLWARKLPLRPEHPIRDRKWPRKQSTWPCGHYRTLPSGWKRPLFVTSLYSITPKWSETTTQLVCTGPKQSKTTNSTKFLFCPFKKQKNWNFVLTLESISCKLRFSDLDCKSIYPKERELLFCCPGGTAVAILEVYEHHMRVYPGIYCTVPVVTNFFSPQTK